MMINFLIFLAGLAIYAGYGIPGLAYLMAATAISYIAGLLIPKHRWVMHVSVILNAAMLVAVKLQPVTGMEILAPMGVSYFTLQIISYHVDLYRGKYEPERNVLKYGMYVTYLPHIFLGPIERYDSFVPACFDNRKITWDGISSGAARALWGLFKKLVIAFRAGVIVSAISADPTQFRGAYAFAAMLMYSVQLYADFSGGIDMVLGVSRMLGIRMSENFNAPYFSESFQEFWRRWHMTLGSWLRAYVYIPLGGNRKGKARKLFNSIVTFLVSGLWHGVHYLLWGLINGVFVAFGEKLKTRFKFLNRIVTFLMVTILWSFFVWPETGTALRMIGSLFTTFNYGAFFAGVGELGLNLGESIVFAASVLALWGYDVFRDRIEKKFHSLCSAGRLAVIGALGLVILVFGMYGIGFNAEEFIYSRF
ncbi:MAG: MBOAT family protein [Oscillospiraceae bacterium]|nr:MBOAT family protein [Oscillospiraceae bacterium]